MKISIILIITFLSVNAFSQSKKQQILTLQYKSDSLKKVLSARGETIKDKNYQILSLNDSLQQSLTREKELIRALDIFKTQINNDYTKIENLKKEISVLKHKNDSITKLYLKEINKFEITTFTSNSVPKEMRSEGYCICALSKEQYNSGDYVYFDDMGGTAMISINNKIVILSHTDKDNDLLREGYGRYTNGEYTVYIKKRVPGEYEDFDGYFELIVFNKFGVKMVKKGYARCFYL